jgi:hypothetical protein
VEAVAAATWRWRSRHRELFETHVIGTREVYREGAANSARAASASQNESLRLRDGFESMTARLCRGRTLPNIFRLNRCD